MKIHSSKLATQDIFAAKITAGPGVLFLDTPYAAGSRKRRSSWVVRLCSDGTPDIDGTPRRFTTQTGTHGAGYERAASWSDWGRFLAALFEIDQEAVCGNYASADDFHAKTAGRFHADASPELCRAVNNGTEAYRATR